MNQALLETVEVGPSKQVDAAVIWMHGLGADGHDFPPVVPALGLPDESRIRFIFPHAPKRPVTINNGFVMRAWYDIAVMGGSIRQDETGIRDSERLIIELIKRENQRGVSSNRILLAGFSQGAAMSLHIGLRYPERLAGLLVLSGYLPLAETLAAERLPANNQTPIFMGHGIHDTMVPMALGTQSQQYLQSLGYQVEFKSYPMEHSVHPTELADIGLWLIRVLQLA